MITWGEFHLLRPIEARILLFAQFVWHLKNISSKLVSDVRFWGLSHPRNIGAGSRQPLANYFLGPREKGEIRAAARFFPRSASDLERERDVLVRNIKEARSHPLMTKNDDASGRDFEGSMKVVRSSNGEREIDSNKGRRGLKARTSKANSRGIH